MPKKTQRFTDHKEKPCESRCDVKRAVVEARALPSANAQMVAAFEKALRK